MRRVIWDIAKEEQGTERGHIKILGKEETGDKEGVEYEEKPVLISKV